MRTKVLSTSAGVTVERLLLTGLECQQIIQEHPFGCSFTLEMWEQFFDLHFVVFKILIGSDPPRYVASRITFNFDHFGLEEEEISPYLNVIDRQFNYLVEHLGEIVAQATEMLIEESEIWNYGQMRTSGVAKKIWERELKSLPSGAYHTGGRMKQLQDKWGAAAHKRLIGFGTAYTGDSKIKLRLPSGQRDMLRSWYEQLKPVCLRVRKASQTKGDIKTAAKLFDKKTKTGISFVDSRESYLDDDLIEALQKRKSNRQYQYKPYQVAAVQAARLTTSLALDYTFRGFAKIGMEQAREIMLPIIKKRVT